MKKTQTFIKFFKNPRIDAEIITPIKIKEIY